MIAAATSMSRGTTSAALEGMARAERLHRAGRAARLPRRAPRGPEVHQRLVEVVGAPARDESAREIPPARLAAHPAQPARAEKDATEHAANVRVQDRCVL